MFHVTGRGCRGREQGAPVRALWPRHAPLCSSRRSSRRWPRSRRPHRASSVPGASRRPPSVGAQCVVGSDPLAPRSRQGPSQPAAAVVGPGGVQKREAGKRGLKREPPWGKEKTWQRPTLPPPDEAVPSARKGLTSVFGMGTGVSPSLWSPGSSSSRCCARRLPGKRCLTALTGCCRLRRGYR